GAVLVIVHRDDRGPVLKIADGSQSADLKLRQSGRKIVDVHVGDPELLGYILAAVHRYAGQVDARRAESALIDRARREYVRVTEHYLCDRNIHSDRRRGYRANGLRIYIIRVTLCHSRKPARAAREVVIDLNGPLIVIGRVIGVDQVIG